ncbi:N-glycanase Pngl [Leptinotarsa decemlineata]|uniref:N-glycanase Pngl n=1 Tax=Leptinotarsa decemlineata TaxID=7539 RepID=UPI003D307F93
MSYQEILNKLKKNQQKMYEETVRILCKIADNILENPENLKFRTLQKSNQTVTSKIISVSGGVECLKAMGFVEEKNVYVMNSNASLEVVDRFRQALSSWQQEKKQSENEKCKDDSLNLSEPNKVLDTKQEDQKRADISNGKDSEVGNLESIRCNRMPPANLIYKNDFLNKIESYFHNALQYEDKNLQERVRCLIPVRVLEENSQRNLRRIQECIKKNKLEDPEISIQDMMVLELLRWFKEDFFVWVDNPECESCGSETVFSHVSTERNLELFSDKVEYHRCKKCQHETPFPRYNDLNILIETRKGRCGEWANVFTLFCRTMGWDSRLIIDEGDHVWTEVYSVTQRRWVHCDPCENECDVPLIYENGWKKKISYVIAYSAEEVQDVTWRYSSDHKEVLKRRKKCSETELLEALLHIRNDRQKNLSQPRKNYLLRRTLMELVEFLTEKKPNEDSKKGRTSGSEVWRLARGEIRKPSKETAFVWKIEKDTLVGNTATIGYSSTLDKYEYISEGNIFKSVTGWDEGAYSHKSIFRKEEKDWKMVYLARKEGEDDGIISWKFDWSNSGRILDAVTLKLEYFTIESGKVEVQMSSGDKCMSIPKGTKTATFRDFNLAKELTVTAKLSGGTGGVSWQHAQLFRQSVENEDFDFTLTFAFKS